jgi:hypothetical protein
MACGRRFGKDVYEMNKVIEPAINGHPAAFAAPTYKVLSENWRQVNHLVAPIIKRRDAQERRLELATGGVIDFWSLDNPDMIRGRKYKRFVINEAGFVPNLMDIWNFIIRATLVDMEGDAIMGGTPKGRNGFWQMYNFGVDNEMPEWVCWQMTSYENPFVPASEIDEMVQTLPEEVVRQEIYAEFIEGEGQVFRNIAPCMNAPLNASPEDHEGHNIVFGNDWGKQKDFTAISVGCVDCMVEVDKDRFNQIDYAFQRQRLQVMAEKWRPSQILSEQNAMGDPIIEQLQRDDLPVIPFQTTAQSKMPLIENLALAFEREEWQFQADPVWTSELDTVIARALMIRSGSVWYFT